MVVLDWHILAIESRSCSFVFRVQGRLPELFPKILPLFSALNFSNYLPLKTGEPVKTITFKQ
jgi:hypothetical protein